MEMRFNKVKLSGVKDINETKNSACNHIIQYSKENKDELDINESMDSFIGKLKSLPINEISITTRIELKDSYPLYYQVDTNILIGVLTNSSNRSEESVVGSIKNIKRKNNCHYGDIIFGKSDLAKSIIKDIKNGKKFQLSVYRLSDRCQVQVAVETLASKKLRFNFIDYMFIISPIELSNIPHVFDAEWICTNKLIISKDGDCDK